MQEIAFSRREIGKSGKTHKVTMTGEQRQKTRTHMTRHTRLQ